MSINMEKMRARYETLKNGNGARNNQFWKPEEGEQTVRLITPSDGDPFRDFWFHYDVGGEPGFLSRKQAPTWWSRIRDRRVRLSLKLKSLRGASLRLCTRILQPPQVFWTQCQITMKFLQMLKEPQPTFKTFLIDF